jgi:predicted nucleic acid-binding protein
MCCLHPYKSSEKILEEETKKRKVKFHIILLEDLLNEMIKKTQEKASISEIEGSRAFIGLNCNTRDDKSIQCKYDIKIYLYKEDHIIKCYSDSQHSSYEIECTHYSYKSSFNLSDSNSFIKNTEKLILSIYNTLEPGVLMLMGKSHINISTVAFMNPNEPIKKNPEISKDGNLLRYNSGKYKIMMAWRFY